MHYWARARKNLIKPEDEQTPRFVAQCINTFRRDARKVRLPLTRRSLALVAVLACITAVVYGVTHFTPPFAALVTGYLPVASISPHSIYRHSPPVLADSDGEGAGSQAFTIISLLALPASVAGMSPEALQSDRASLHAWYCLMSWSLAVGPSNVLVYVDSASTCEWLIERPEVRGIQCFQVPALHPTYKRPLLPQLFEHAHAHTGNSVIAFLSKPAFLHPAVNSLIANISSSLARFCLVTRRMDISLPEAILDPQTFSAYSSSAFPFVTPSNPEYRPAYQSLMSGYLSTLSLTFEHALHYGKLHSEYGIDLFIYPKEIFHTLTLPPYLMGVYRWDNWLLSEMILRDDITTVDASSAALPLLVHDGVESESHSIVDGANYNDRLTKLRSGNQYKLGNTENADFKLDGVCPACLLVKNHAQNVAVMFAKRVNSDQSLAVFSHDAPLADTQALSLLHNLICWSKRIGFNHFILLVDDAAVATHLLSHGLPVLHRSNDSLIHAGEESRSLAALFSPSTNFASFYVRVLQFILKSGYNFFAGPSAALLFDDPLVYIDRTLDVQASVNVTSEGPGQTAFFATRATTYGRDFVAKLKDCVEKTPVPEFLSAMRTCVASSWKAQKKNRNVKRALIEPLKFSTSKQFFSAKISQRAGIPAATVDLSDSLSGNEKERSKVWHWVRAWQLMIATESHRCQRPLYATLPAPATAALAHIPHGSSASATVSPPAFSLKIKVITAFRPKALHALLASLASAIYDDDQVELELCIDGLPVSTPSPKELAKHQEVKKLVSDFVWTQGSLAVTEEKESKRGPGQHGEWKGKGATGAFLSAWTPSKTNPHQVLLLLPDFVTVSPIFYQYVKRLVTAYYLSPSRYDPQLYGISLQSSMPILGTDIEVSENLLDDQLLYRYQSYGSLGTVFFPQHWREFQSWIAAKGYQTSHGQLFAESLLHGFTNGTAASALSRTNISSVCLPSQPSNQWWLSWIDKYNHTVPTNATLTFAIDHLYPLFFARFLYERGFYALFPRLPNNGQLVVQSAADRVRTIYAWSAEKEARIQAEIRKSQLKAPSLLTALPFYNDRMLALDELPFFDLHGLPLTPNNNAINSHAARMTSQATLEDEDADAVEEHTSDSTSFASLLWHRRPRSLLLSYRPYQYQASSQCAVVKRASTKRKDSALHKAASTATPPRSGLTAASPAKVPAPPSVVGAVLSPSNLDDEGEVESRVARSEFLQKWSEGGRSE